MLEGKFDLSNTYPHAYEGTPIGQTLIDIPWYVTGSELADELGFDPAFGDVTVTRSRFIPSTYKRWTGGYIWAITYVGRQGKIPLLTIAASASQSLTSNSGIATMDTGDATTALALVDPDNTAGTARHGNQVGGSYFLDFVDSYGNVFNATIPIVDASTNQALDAAGLETLLNDMFSEKGYNNTVNVTRSDDYNNVMGYTYSVTFIGENVGGDVSPFIIDTDLLTKSASYGTVVADVEVSEEVVGANLQGTFQLRFGGYTTSPLPFDAEAAYVENALNALVSISPSRVKVSRSDPIFTPSTQVFGYVWSITFTSNTWKDPSITHDVYTDGNWQGAATTWADTWSSGYSKAWGKNVGDVDIIECNDAALFVSNGVLPSDGCLVEEVVPGTPPLSGTFTLTLDTTDHSVINIQASRTTGDIYHNAFATAADSNGDGTSMEEKLEALDNIGDVSVSRSDVDPKNGGYTWFITFLRDDSQPGGQFGDDCEQRDSYYNLCNAPGDVPALTFDSSDLGGACLSHDIASGSYNCSLITILTDAVSNPTAEPPGSKEVQRITIDNPNWDADFQTTEEFQIKTQSTNVQTSACLSVFATAQEVQDAIEQFTDYSSGVEVTEVLDTVNARNSRVWTIYFFNEGDLDELVVEKCASTPNTYDWSFSITTVIDGEKYGMTATDAGVINGVVQRGTFTTFSVIDETFSNVSSLAWNAPAEGNNSVKAYIDTSSSHVVNVTRVVIGKYGVVEYEVRFVYNAGQTPPGTGDVNMLNVTQEAAISGVVSATSVRASEGFLGSLRHFYY